MSIIQPLATELKGFCANLAAFMLPSEIAQGSLPTLAKHDMSLDRQEHAICTNGDEGAANSSDAAFILLGMLVNVLVETSNRIEGYITGLLRLT